MNQPRKPPLKLMGVDKEYSREIVHDYIDDADARRKLAAKYAQATAPAAPVPEHDAKEPSSDRDDPEEHGRGKKPAPEKTADSSAATKVHVRPLVRPLTRQQEELDALADQGYSVDVVLRRARQETQRKFRLKPDFSPMPAVEEAKGRDHRLILSVRLSDLKALSEQARDLGTMPHTKLIASQVHSLWIEELDAIIADLKRKTL